MESCKNHIRIFQSTGDVCPKKATGNRSEREILGSDLEQLALYRSVYPEATNAECRAYLFNSQPHPPAQTDPYSHSQLQRAENLLGLTRKNGSTTAQLAYHPDNLQKRDLYWTQPPPLGVAGVPRQNMIDIDEAGFKLEHSNRKFGKTPTALRCSQEGAYGRDEKLNLLLAISGDENDPMRWHDVWMNGGTTIAKFADFIQLILDDLALRHPGRVFCFTMDNLNSHKNPIVLNKIINAGHQYAFRAPYWPVDGAIEYVFNTIQTRLQAYFNRLVDMAALQNRINLIIATFGSFHRYFIHVGFPP